MWDRDTVSWGYFSSWEASVRTPRRKPSDAWRGELLASLLFDPCNTSDTVLQRSAARSPCRHDLVQRAYGPARAHSGGHLCPRRVCNFLDSELQCFRVGSARGRGAAETLLAGFLRKAIEKGQKCRRGDTTAFEVPRQVA